MDTLNSERNRFSNRIRSMLEAIDSEDENCIPKLDADIRKQLDLDLDDLNKFNRLLTIHPSKVDPMIYLAFYRSLPERPEQELLIVLIRRLVFHSDYRACWNVILTNFSTLTDLEDVIEVIFTELDNSSDKVFGIFDLVMAGKSSITSYKMCNTILEIMKHKESVLVEESIRVVELLNEDENFQIPKRTDSVLYQMAYCRSLENSDLSALEKGFALLKLLESNSFESPLISTPGWLRSLANYFPDIVTQVAMENIIYESHCRLNSFDIIQLLKDLTTIPQPLRLLATYKTIILRELTHESRVGELIEHSIPDIYSSKEVELAVLLYHLLDYRVSRKLIDRLVCEDLHVRTLVRSMGKQSKTVLLDFSKLFISSAVEAESLVHITTLFEEVKSPFLIKHLVSCVMTSLRSVALGSSKLSLFIRKMLESCLPCTAQLQLLRETLIYYKIKDLQLFTLLVENSFKSLWGTSDSTGAKKFKTFKEFYDSSSKIQRQILHNHIRALAQLLSTLPKHCITDVLKPLQSIKFPFVDKKQYILSKTLDELIRFLIRNENSDIDTVEQIIQTISMSHSMLDAYRYRYAVGKDPSAAIMFLHQNIQQKSWLNKHVMSSISLSILDSDKLEPKERLKLFQAFRLRMKELGYKNKLRSKEIIELVNLILRLAAEDPKVDINQRDLRNVIGTFDGIPSRIKKNWKKQLRLIVNGKQNHQYGSSNG